MTKRLLACVLLLCGVAPAQWVKQNSGTDASLRGVNAVSDKICWASGTGGTVLKTTDGGNHWRMIHVAGAEKLDFRDIEAPNNDANTAIVMSSGPAEQGQAKIFKTTDGGENWKLVFSTDRKGVFFDSIAFWDNQHGIGMSDPVDDKFVLFATDDGGDTWHFLESPQLLTALPGEGAFAASGTTIVPNVDSLSGSSLGRNASFVTGGADQARIFTSTDDGKKWSSVSVPEMGGSPSTGFFSATFLTAMFFGGQGIVVGGDYSHPDKKGKYVYTNITKRDGWEPLDAEVPYLSGVSQLSEGVNVIAVGPSGCVEIEWRQGLTVRDAHCKLPLNSISRNPEGKKVWAVGPKGTIMTRKVKTFKVVLE